MKILSNWLRSYVPGATEDDRRLAELLTLRGIAVEGIFDLGPGRGSLFEMDITTNRVDAMNHYGIARELAAACGLPLSPLDAVLPEAHGGPPAIAVSIEEPALCGRFTARSLSGVRVGPSSGIVAERFALLEQKSISNAVDATNYVLLAMGHPSHAFDRDKLEGGILVRRARKGEKLRTLDGVERSLDPEDLIVADEKKPLALAGVMGGWETMIAAETRNILVEAAWFDPGTIRRSGKRHGLHTDASHRFERGADFQAPPVASAMVSRIILSDGGRLEGDPVDVCIPEAAARTAGRDRIFLRNAEVHRILGATEDGRGIEPQTTENVLTSLGCELRREEGGAYSVALPSWRLDLEREIDLIEEIARAYGYNRFANTLPVSTGVCSALPNSAQDRAIRMTLLALGWNEAVSGSFCSRQEAEFYSSQPGMTVSLANPINEEAGCLRPSLVPGMLSMLANNLNRNVEGVLLFEAGHVFNGNADRVEERPNLCLGATGAFANGPHLAAHLFDFYDLKGAIEALLAKFAARSVYFDAFPLDPTIGPPWLQPGRSARAVADGVTVCWFGQLHPAVAQSRKIRQALYVAEIYLDRLYRLPLRQPIAKELSRFQSVQRDFSFVFPNSVVWSQIADALDGLSIAELTGYAPREIYRGRHGAAEAIPADHFSLLLGVTFQSRERTLRDDELQGFSLAIAKALASLGGKQRA